MSDWEPKCVTHHDACDCREAAHSNDKISLRREACELRAMLNGHEELQSGIIMLETILREANRKLEIARAALEFYATRKVFEHLSQFKGDGQFVECDDIAKDALAAIDSDSEPANKTAREGGKKEV